MSSAPPKILIRASTAADVPAMVAIYNHHISTGLGDFDAAREARLLEAEDLGRRRKNMRKHCLPRGVSATHRLYRSGEPGVAAAA